MQPRKTVQYRSAQSSQCLLQSAPRRYRHRLDISSFQHYLRHLLIYTSWSAQHPRKGLSTSGLSDILPAPCCSHLRSTRSIWEPEPRPYHLSQAWTSNQGSDCGGHCRLRLIYYLGTPRHERLPNLEDPIKNSLRAFPDRRICLPAVPGESLSHSRSL